jgi:hypothetical protein
MLRSGAAIAFVVLLSGSLSGGAVGDTTSFLRTLYYPLLLGRVAADVDSVP